MIMCTGEKIKKIASNFMTTPNDIDPFEIMLSWIKYSTLYITKTCLIIFLISIKLSYITFIKAIGMAYMTYAPRPG